MYKIISIDLDETLLNHNKEISDENLKALKYAQEKGVIIAFNTGRAYKNMKVYLKNEDLNVISICSSGSSIYNENQKQIYCKPFKRYISRMLIDSLQKIEDCEFHFFDKTGQTLYCEQLSDSIQYIHEFNHTVKREDRLEIRILPDAYDFIVFNDIELIKISVDINKNTLDSLNKVLSQFENDIEVEKAGHFFDIMRKDTNKLNGLQELCKIHNIDIKDCIAIGDGIIDISMVNGAGLGVAVANGHDDLKKVADYVTKNDNNNDAIAEVIYKYIK